jgi:hypothetical protein
MVNRKNIISFLVKSLLVFAFMVAVVVVFTPSLINQEMVKKSIEETISKEVGGRITYRSLTLAYFPRPHVVIYKAKIDIPDSFTIGIQWMRIFPKILPLLRGELRADLVRLDYADYFMKLPQIKDAPSRPGQIVSFDQIIRSLSAAVRGLPEFKLPNLNLRVKNGRVNLVDPLGRAFKLRELQADYVNSRDRLDFSINCKSNLWAQIDVSGTIDPSDFKGRGTIRLSRFRPQTLMAYLFPGSTLQVTETRANVIIKFESDGAGNVKADANGSIPFLELRRGREKLVIKGGQLNGTIEVGGKTTRATLTELRLDYPSLNLTGMFSYDENLRDIQLALNGSRIDADSVRQLALGLAGESEIIQTLFDVIRGGQVPWITVSLQGQTIEDFGKLQNINIKGRMTQGKIFIPGAELNLEDVFGDAVISEGILQGEKLTARMGKSQGQNGTIALGLNEKLAPFQLNIRVDADVSQLPPILNRIVPHKDFLDEIGLVKDFKGRAVGMLMLGDDLTNLSARVEVSEVHLTARYDRLPDSIQIDGGHFVYRGTRIALENFNAAIGNSSLSKLSAAIDWAQTPNLKVASQEAQFDVNDLYNWLQSMGPLKKNLADVRSLKGRLAVGTLHISGPMFSPQKWSFQTRGTINSLILNSDRLPKPLHIARGRFSWQNTGIVFDDVAATMGKSEISHLSAAIGLNPTIGFELRCQTAKLFADEIYPWLSSSKQLQPSFKVFSTIRGVLALSNLDLKGPSRDPAAWQYHLTGNLQNLEVHSAALSEPVTIDSGVFYLSREPSSDADHNRVDLQAVKLNWDASHLSLMGTMKLSADEILLNMEAGADKLDWKQIRHILDSIAEDEAATDQSGRQRTLRGKVQVMLENFSYESYTARPLEAEISFKPEKVIVAINQADVCGISLRGLLNIADQTLDVYFVPTATGSDLNASLACLSTTRAMATGTYDFTGEIMAKTKPDALERSLTGKLTFSAEKGRIYRFGLLAKVLAILNVTEIYRGNIPDLTGEGFAYHSMAASAKLQGGKIIMEDCSIDGASMGIACKGDIDLVKKEMDLVILVAPFKTVDRIVELLPFISGILGGKLISIPFRAKGDLNDPDVVPLSPTAVGSGILGILERTLKLPITIIEPVISGLKKGKPNPTATDQDSPR